MNIYYEIFKIEYSAEGNEFEFVKQFSSKEIALGWIYESGRNHITYTIIETFIKR